MSELRKLAWISQALPSGPLSENLKSHIASIRYRILIPARELQKRGVESVVISPEADARQSVELLRGCRSAVFGKLSLFEPRAFLESARRHLALAARAQSLGVRVVADICEDRFEHELLGPYWKDIVRTADKIITSTTLLADLARKLGAVDVEVISDPVEGDGGPPEFGQGAGDGNRATTSTEPSRRPIRILWFGHQSNIDEVHEFLPALDRWAHAKGIPAIFRIVTAPGFGMEQLAAGRKSSGSIVFVEYVAWSPQSADSCLRDCDMVVIPATLQNLRKLSKSANRLTESLHAGRYVLAHPVPSYLEFQECAWIRDDLLEGVDWALEHPDLAVAQIRKGQRLIADRFLPAAIAEKWEAALKLGR